MTNNRDGRSTKSVVLKIGGLHCEGCANNLRNALKSVEGVTETDLDFGRQRATVVFRPEQADEAKLRKTIRDAGYLAR